MNDALLECLEKGKEIEAFGIKFYNEAANSIEDPKGKSTLQFLAREEHHHLGFIQELIDSIKKGSGISPVIQKKIPKIFPEKREFKEQVASGEGDKKILDEAMKVEDRSIEFYSNCQSRVEGEEKGIFQTLVKEEEKHKAWLDYMKDGMEVHGYWYDLGERFAFDG
jgi:rubrerythrin